MNTRIINSLCSHELTLNLRGFEFISSKSAFQLNGLLPRPHDEISGTFPENALPHPIFRYCLTTPSFLLIDKGDNDFLFAYAMLFDCLVYGMLASRIQCKIFRHTAYERHDWEMTITAASVNVI